MKTKKKNWSIGLGVILCALFLMALTVPAPDAFAEVKQLSMGTATVGGIFYNLGAPITQCVNKALPEVNITAEITQGSVENLDSSRSYPARRNLCTRKQNPE